jgi:hypothetical protein
MTRTYGSGTAKSLWRAAPSRHRRLPLRPRSHSYSLPKTPSPPPVFGARAGRIREEERAPLILLFAGSPWFAAPSDSPDGIPAAGAREAGDVTKSAATHHSNVPEEHRIDAIASNV